MIKLILQVNPRAGFEDVVYDKINEVFDNPIMSRLAQLSDFYTVLKMTEENVKKVSAIQDFEGILDLQLIPVDVVVHPTEKMPAGQELFIVLVKAERGMHEQTLKNLAASDKYNIVYAGYFFENRADIILEVTTDGTLRELTDAIRRTEGVEDTILYTT